MEENEGKEEMESDDMEYNSMVVQTGKGSADLFEDKV